MCLVVIDIVQMGCGFVSIFIIGFPYECDYDQVRAARKSTLELPAKVVKPKVIHCCDLFVFLGYIVGI